VNFNLILKYKHGIFRIVSLIFCILLAESINAQSPISDSLNLNFKKNILNQTSDSTNQKTAHSQSLDTLKSKTVDSLDIPKSDIETRIFYSCRDSIRMNMAEQKVYLYGDAKVTYGSRVLTSEYMEINWALNEVTSYGGIDTATGKTIGRPVFKEGADMYTAEQIRYNMKSGKGIIKGIVTKQGDGYIQGGPVKKTPEAIYVNNALYTTCNLPHPHFSINATKLKVIPGDKVVTGPFHMQIMGIHTPLGLPLGFFPVTRRSKSGIIFPTIGEQRSRGFFISNGGYYWAVNDYVGVKLLGDVYANQSYRVSASANYIKRYAHSGSAMFSYSKVKEGFDDATKAPALINVRWTHRTIGNKAARFTADVNISSSKFYTTNSYNPVNYQSTSFSSNVTWSKAFRNSPFSLTIAGRQDQNTTTKVMNVTLPEVNFSMNRIYPLKAKGSDGTKWYEKINISYNGNTKYAVSNKLNASTSTLNGEIIQKDSVLDFQSNMSDILSNGQWGVKNAIPIETSFKLMKYFSLNPRVSYENWIYAKNLNYATVKDPFGKAVTAQPSGYAEGFNMAHSVNASTALTTRIYGTYRINSKILQAIRHTFIPTLSYTYRPDMVQLDHGGKYFYTDTLLRDKYGNEIPYSRYQGFIYNGPVSGTVNSLSINLQNTIEGKGRNRKDTTGSSPTKKIDLIKSLNASGSYNFSADSLRWSLIQLTAQSRFFDKIDFNFSSTFDPYIYITDSIVGEKYYQRRIGEFALNDPREDHKKKLAYLTNYNVALSTNLNPKGQKSQPRPVNQLNPENNNYVVANNAQYIDFNIPWNLFISYTLAYTKYGDAPETFNNSLSFSGDLKLSDNWKIKFTSGYDIKKQALTFTTLQLFRDLHCWQMSLNVVPIGPQQSFFFTLNAKSSLLRDLKLTKQNPTYLGGY